MSSDSEEFSNTTESQYYLEIWQNRAWLWVVVVSALILLLAWGFAIIPTGTLPAWGWWPVTLGCAGLVIYRLRLEQKLARVYLHKSGQKTFLEEYTAKPGYSSCYRFGSKLARHRPLPATATLRLI